MQEKTDKRMRAALFRQGLMAAMRDRNASQSALSRRIGVDRSTVSQLLKDEGLEVATAHNGAQALERLSEQAPDLILLDLMMPVMDGFEFLVHKRAEPEWRNIPVVVLTAKDLTEEDKRVLSGRVEQIYEKQALSNDHLVDVVHSAVSALRQVP